MPAAKLKRRLWPSCSALRVIPIPRACSARCPSSALPLPARRGGSPKSLGKCPASRSGSRRSEEHTSELQSHLNLVCRLLLEKKKKNKTPIISEMSYSDLKRTQY